MSGLTDSDEWDDYWRAAVRELPVEITRDRAWGLQTCAILDVFDRWLADTPPRRVLEVGGSPGRFLAYLHRTTGCECSILDFSPHGCELARENFRLLDIPLTTYEIDVFEANDLPAFDLVYSLGLIEHFDDLTQIVEAHRRLVADEGKLILGAPNFRGFNGWMAQRIDPSRLRGQNLESEDISSWKNFESLLDLERLFLGYVGGFEPGVFATVREPPRSRTLWLVARALSLTLSYRFASLRRLNHPAFSGYLMGAWRVPSTNQTISP
jgi:SAM-dependent methyltransferase